MIQQLEQGSLPNPKVRAFVDFMGEAHPDGVLTLASL